jgi:PBP1b-binding outer membrane lipoprotein LpoB
MKKVFAILAVAGLMTACNNAAAPEVKADSTAKVDTTKKVDSSAVKVDSTAKVDSTKK